MDESREVRVFVSSTFRDMQAEREELLKRIFPRLRRICERRGVTWGEVDLRWGITDEQTAEGRVLPICLEEIRGCRPYFLGLLGERYGWVPDDIPPDLIERQPWLREHRERSVTELEILHGVLNDPRMAPFAFFYFRSPAYLDALAPRDRAGFREEASEEEIAALGRDEAEKRAEARRTKLVALKERIRASGLPVREGYETPRELGCLVFRDLTRAIRRRFPRGSEPGPLARAAADHEAFARSRALGYVRRDDDFRRLDRHAEGSGPPLVVRGESGVGKSALLANWGLARRRDHSEERVVLHFIGGAPGSADWASMLRRILLEIAGPEESVDVPEEPEALRVAFAERLRVAGERGRLLLILDALDQLEDRDQAPDLVWLPSEIPPAVRLVVSSLPGRPMAELERRGWPTLEVAPLSTDERRRMVVRYLALYTKALSPDRVDRIAGAPQTANPLFLRAMLEELRLWGDHDTLGPRIGHYLDAITIDDLYERILARYEEDYETERPGLVRDAFSLLWAARRGLSQTELLEMLAVDRDRLPRAHWSPLYLAAESSLVNRSGLIGFFHEHLRRAVRDRYLPTVAEREASHLRLADYFLGRELGSRTVEELPWQLARAGSWDRLRDLLADLSFFAAAWKHDRFDVERRWAEVEQNSSWRLTDAYAPVFHDPVAHASCAQEVAHLLMDTGHFAEVEKIMSGLFRHQASESDLGGVQSLFGLAAVKAKRGDLDGAAEIHRAMEGMWRELNDAAAWRHLGDGEVPAALRTIRNVLAKHLSNEAGVLRARGDVPGARACLLEAEELFREAGDPAGLANCVGSQAVLLLEAGDTSAGLQRLEEAEGYARRAGDPELLAQALAARAQALAHLGETRAADELYAEAGELLRDIGSIPGRARLLASRANGQRDQGRLKSAAELYGEAAALLRDTGERIELSRVLYFLAQVQARLQQWGSAVRSAEEAWLLAAETGGGADPESVRQLLEHCRAKAAR